MTTMLRVFLAATAVVLSSCGGGDSLPSQQGHLRFVNATNGAGPLDLFATGQAVATGVAPISSSGYADLDHDTYTLTVRSSGTGATLATTTTTLDKKVHQTLVAATNDGSMVATILGDDEPDPSKGNAKLRIFNTQTAATDAVDVYVIGVACSALSSSVAAPFAAGVSGLQPAYTEISASATSFHVCVTSPGDKSDIRLDIPSLALSEQRIVTIVLAPGSGGVLLHAVVLDQQGAASSELNTSARVRVAASLSPAAPVDVDVNGTTVAAGLATPSVGPYRVVSAGTLVVKVNGTTIAPATPLVAAPGGDVTLLLTGATPTVTLLADDNTPSSSAARPVKLRLVNGLNGVTGTATLTVDNAPVGNGAASGTASDYSLLPSSAALARVEARAGATQLYLANNVTFSAGRVYSLFLLGDGTAPLNNGVLIADR